MRDAGSLARDRDDVGRLCTEHAVENFIRGYRECDDQPDRRAFIAHAEGGDVEFRHDVVDRLFGQLWEVPLGQVVADLRNGVHLLKVAVQPRCWNRVFPYVFETWQLWPESPIRLLEVGHQGSVGSARWHRIPAKPNRSAPDNMDVSAWFVSEHPECVSRSIPST